MARLKRLMTRMTKPLKAAEWVLPTTIIISAILSITESVVVEEHGKDASSLSQLIEQFEIVSAVLAVLAVFGIIHIIELLTPEGYRSMRVRQISLFAYTIGLFFIGMLTITAFGPLTLLWVNEIALACISAILYLHLRVILNERQR